LFLDNDMQCMLMICKCMKFCHDFRRGIQTQDYSHVGYVRITGRSKGFSDHKKFPKVGSKVMFSRKELRLTDQVQNFLAMVG
jgi:hypothetical protein